MMRVYKYPASIEEFAGVAGFLFCKLKVNEKSYTTMNRSKTAKINTVLRNTILAGAAVVVILTVGAGGQQGLSDLVTMGGFEWLIGDWMATTDQGGEIHSFYKWELNKNVITMGFKMGEFEGRGMIYYEPAEERVVQIGVDNRGGIA